MRYLLSVAIVWLSFTAIQAQTAKPKDLYFLADTLSTPRESRIVGIGTEGDFHYYQFYCKCLPPYVFDLAFVCPGTTVSEYIYTTKPALKYTSYPDLLQLVLKAGHQFEKEYTLYIIEALPGNKFSKNKVVLANGQGG